MADGIWSPQADPVAGAMNNGAQWAFQSATIGLQREHLQQQQQQHEEMKRQFDVTVAGQKLQKFQTYASMPDGPGKNAYGKSIQDWGAQIGNPYSDTIMAAGKDNHWTPKINNLFKFIADPAHNTDVGGEAVLDIAQHMAGDDWMHPLEKFTAAAATSMSSINKNQGYLSARTLPAAIQEGQAARKAPDLALTAIQRLENGIQAVQRGEVESTPEYWAKLQMEDAKILNGGGAFTEGSIERTQIKNLDNEITKMLQFGASAPKGAALTKWLKQISGEAGATKRSYMDQVDTAHDTLKGSWQDVPGAASAIDSGFNAYRSSMTKRFGGWSGYKGASKKDASQSPEPEESSASDTPTPPPGDKIRADQVQTAKDLYQQIQSGVMNGVKLSEGGKKAAQKRYETTYSKSIRQEAEKAGNQ